MADNFNISDVPEGAGPKSVEVPGDIADGTAGELMTWDAAGVSALVAAGSATDVLTSNGAGAEPTFQPGGGAAPVDSVFSRTGVVVAVAGDYAASEVGNDSSVAGAFVDDALNNLRSAACQARRTTDFLLGTTFANITFDVTDVELDAAIIDHDLVTNTDRIIFLVAGTYQIEYHYDGEPPASVGDVATIASRVLLNDAGVALPGSIGGATTFNDSSIDGEELFIQVGLTFYLTVAANDYITLQANKTHPTGASATNLTGTTVVMSAKRVQ